ncbi:MAG TPA: 30S ribosome-binding factor RbfA [Chitinophagales bacterium]|nr:30S ribosome-binding factor RbfA [Chitinophagales bacterium]
MDSRRQLKIASLIKEEFTSILNKEGKSIYGTAFVTVTNVTVTSDLTLARFYLSIYNTESPDAVIERFNERKYELKRHLANALRHHLRRIPEIEFFKDDTLDYVSHIEEVFKKISGENEALQEEKNRKKPAIKKTKTVARKAASKKPGK